MSGGLSPSPCPGSGSPSGPCWRSPPLCRGCSPPPAVPREPASGGGHVQAEALLPVPAGVLPAAQPPPRTPSALCRPCPQVPASLHAPASCSASRPGAGRGSGTPWSIPGTADCCPRRGPGWRRCTCRQSRARMGGPTGRTGGSRQTNWLRPTAIRRSDGFPGPLRDRHTVARGVPAPALRAGRHGIP